jgi:hypothetical protein
MTPKMLVMTMEASQETVATKEHKYLRKKAIAQTYNSHKLEQAQRCLHLQI